MKHCLNSDGTSAEMSGIHGIDTTWLHAAPVSIMPQ